MGTQIWLIGWDAKPITEKFASYYSCVDTVTNTVYEPQLKGKYFSRTQAQRYILSIANAMQLSNYDYQENILTQKHLGRVHTWYIEEI